MTNSVVLLRWRGCDAGRAQGVHIELVVVIAIQANTSHYWWGVEAP
ncbi:MAG TPA: hypothetical protein PK373_08380 [Sedimentisphaerales bacterium]|nr:hypothetical protein [Sedimentisphaerales bacterium]HQG49090.1 hypothetical protein [Sedimentisphaerales bacterium]